MDLGDILLGRWSPWISLSGMASGGPQCTYWPVTPDWSDGKLRQVKNDDVSVRGDPVGNVGGGSWTDKYRERGYLPRKAALLSAVLVLQGEVDGGGNGGSPQATEFHRSINRLGLVTGQSDIAPPPGV